MPKVLEHMRETILHAARQALLTNGYDALTMRGVAKACGCLVRVIKCLAAPDLVVLDYVKSVIAAMK